jgi:hypothetical protein
MGFFLSKAKKPEPEEKPTENTQVNANNLSINPSASKDEPHAQATPEPPSPKKPTSIRATSATTTFEMGYGSPLSVQRTRQAHHRQARGAQNTQPS